MVMVERSTLTLLEHVNLNVPSQEPYVLSFYFDLLGCGLDPRKAANLYHHHQSNNNDASNTKTQKPTTIWANCGSSQFHLPYGGVPQRIYGTVGLRFRADRWEAFRDRVQAELAPRMNHPKVVDPGVSSSASGCCCIKACETGTDREGCDFVRLTDQYDNVFFCRPDFSADVSILDSSERKRLLQPIISPTDTEQWGKEVTARFGRHETDCSGIDYVEFKCPRGTADKIALFYDSVLDATVNVVQDKEDKVAVIALGNVDASTGRADQSLLFRETDEVIPPYDGHHVAMYVGESAADFEQAYRHAEIAGVVWVNPRFSDKADTLNAARHWKQFRFKDVVDMETGEKIFELEHEMRSIEHEAWLGNIH